MPTITAGRPADANEIRSYDDILAVHRDLSRKTAAHAGTSKGEVYADAAVLVCRLGGLYRHSPGTVTDEMRTIAEAALAAIRDGVRATQKGDRFAVARTWLDHLSLLVRRPADGR